MKLKRWLSRGIVLAMVVALMVPMPVAAKGKAGGKLVKSVTYYSPEDGGGWTATSKVAYDYGKKNLPKAITTTSYTKHFLGVPVGGESETVTVKYKGKTAKSYDSAKFLTGKRTYKKGKVVSYTSDNKTSEKKEKNGAYVDFATFTATVGHISYFKNGLRKASDKTFAYQDSANASYSYTSNDVYAWVQKKGVPSMMYKTSVLNGTAMMYDEDDNPIGQTTYTNEPETGYAIFNTKGLTIESGKVVDGKNVAKYAIQYTMKKGKVDTAVVYSVDEKGTPEPVSMMKFKYTKKSVSKTGYLNMMNSLVGHNNGAFRWY